MALAGSLVHGYMLIQAKLPICLSLSYLKKLAFVVGIALIMIRSLLKIPPGVITDMFVDEIDISVKQSSK